MKKLVFLVFLLSVFLLSFVSSSSVSVGFSVMDGPTYPDYENYDSRENSVSFTWFFLLLLGIGLVFILYKFNFTKSKKKSKPVRKSKKRK